MAWVPSNSLRFRRGLQLDGRAPLAAARCIEKQWGEEDRKSKAWRFSPVHSGFPIDTK